MHETADAADALDQVDILDEVLLLGELLNAPVDVADDREGLDDLLVLHHEAQLDRLGKHGVLGTERDGIAANHDALSPSAAGAGALARISMPMPTDLFSGARGAPSDRMKRPL